MDYRIKKTRIEDMKLVEDAHRRSIRELCALDYNSEQVEKYASITYTSDIWENSINNHFHIKVELEGEVEGFCHAKIRDDGDGEIMGLYFTKKIAGYGLGRVVLDRALEYLSSFKAQKVILVGTITAKAFYLKMGFSITEEININLRGTKLRCYKMILDI